MLKKLVIACHIFAAALAPQAAMAADPPIELKLSHFVSPMHGWSTDVYQGWVKELNRRLGGNRVKAEIFAAGSAYGNIARQYDQAAAGIVDVALGLRSTPGGRFQRASIFELPFMFDSASEAAHVMWQLYPKYLAKEFPNVKILAFHAHPGGAIHTRNRAITKLEDVRGLRLRSPGGAVNEYLKALNAEPVGLPPSDLYESLQRGVIDGVATTWSLLETDKLYEVTSNHFDCSCYTAVFYIAMNKARYDRLPPDVRKAIDDVSEEFLVPNIGKWWDKWDVSGHKLVQGLNRPITKLSPEERQRWVKAAQPTIDKWLADLEKNGISDAREIYSSAKRLSAEYVAKHGQR